MVLVQTFNDVRKYHKLYENYPEKMISDSLFLANFSLLNNDILQDILVGLGIVLATTGTVFILQAFFSRPILKQGNKHKKFMIKGLVGLILIWSAGMIAIYLYKIHQKSADIKEMHEKEELPDISTIDFTHES